MMDAQTFKGPEFPPHPCLTRTVGPVTSFIVSIFFCQVRRAKLGSTDVTTEEEERMGGGGHRSSTNRLPGDQSQSLG